MPPASQLKKQIQKTHLGNAWPLGSSITPRGVNFSVLAPYATAIELLLFEHANDEKAATIINLNNENRSGDYWHIEVEGLREGSSYAYRVKSQGQYNHQTRNYSSKVLIDPCSRAISGWDVYQRDSTMGESGNQKTCLKSIVSERDSFDFDSHPRPRHPWTKTVIYELHVGGFTSNNDSGLEDNKKGTFLGLKEKIPYLKDLGITTIELLPVYSFDPSDAPFGLTNYWGYSPLNWFTPHHQYIAGKDPLDARKQFRNLVASCHDAGIEVLIDVVYNHTTEGNKEGPIISWRGFGEELFYYQDKDGNYLDVSGCGNSIAGNRPLVRELILESMRCWATELGVDGFRFDLGIALSRGEELIPLEKPPLFEQIEADPKLSDLKLVSEPWDCGGLYRLSDFPANRIGTWNGQFRDNLRKFWKGDKNSTWLLKDNLRGSPELYKGDQNRLQRSINFITAHDGFTLNDLVSFNIKHNLSNGEDNRDGENHNNSWNHGIEGPTTDQALIALRNRQKKNLLATTIFSPGVPMLLMGDEVSRSQGGNNNTWCQNNPLSWMIWGPDKCDVSLHLFVKKLLKIRSQFPELFSYQNLLKEDLLDEQKSSNQLWIQWHGVKLGKPDWSSWSHTISYSVNKGSQGALMWMGLNAYTQAMHFELPKPITPWERIINTASSSDQIPNKKREEFSQSTVELESYSLTLMITNEYASRSSFNP